MKLKIVLMLITLTNDSHTNDSHTNDSHKTDKSIGLSGKFVSQKI